MNAQKNNAMAVHFEHFDNDALSGAAGLLAVLEGHANATVATMLHGLSNEAKAAMGPQRKYWQNVASGMRWAHSHCMQEIQRRAKHAVATQGKRIRPGRATSGKRIRSS